MYYGIEKFLHAFSSLADLGQEIADTRDYREMVETALQVVLGTLAIRRGAVVEYERDKNVLKFIAARGISHELPPDVAFDGAVVKDLCAGGACGLNLYADEGSGANKELAEKCRALFKDFGFELITPLIIRDTLLGVLLLGRKVSEELFSELDRDVVCAMARHIGVGIYSHRLLAEVEVRAEENRRLYDDLRETYQDTVRAFAAAIDFKDTYTRGHSERVGLYCEIIAREMGWDDEQVEGMIVAGYLHDIGKIFVDREIINAPHRIDAKLLPELNGHTIAGYELLSLIKHPFTDIPLMARHHHERVDGGGYPDGLTGDQIPIGAKILTLADSFDAMTTDRPYKRRRTLEEIIKDLQENAGKQFEPGVVVAFARAILKEIKGETEDKRITKMLAKNYDDVKSIEPLLIELLAKLESPSLNTSTATS